MYDDDLTVLSLKQKADFVETPYVQNIADRAMYYVQAGYPVHFSGPAGTGKTTLAMHVAARLGRPVILIHGDDEYGSSDLIGGQLGYRATKVVDNYIHSVVKSEENVSKVWVDNRLSKACKFGFTLIYDEFNRSRAEANNVLLSILEERLLELPSGRSSEGYLQVHPEFSAIFTSNPEEYVGIHKAQDALLDRMISIKVGHCDRDTETAITAAKSGLDAEAAGRIVDIVRSFRALGVNNHRPTIRACIMIARVTVLRQARVEREDPVFLETCRDIISTDALKITRDGEALGGERLAQFIDQFCSARNHPASSNGTGAPHHGEGKKKHAKHPHHGVACG